MTRVPITACILAVSWLSLTSGCAGDTGEYDSWTTDDETSDRVDALRRRRPGNTPPGAGGATSSGGATSGGGTSNPSGGGGGAVSPLAFQAIDPCSSDADYVRSGVVRVSSAGCSPACVRLASGGTVVFLGPLADSPVSARSATSSPITSSSFGGMAEFEFPDYGFFPYRCGNALGVIWSTYW